VFGALRLSSFLGRDFRLRTGPAARSPKGDPPTLAAVEQKFIESHFRDHHDGAHPLSDWR